MIDPSTPPPPLPELEVIDAATCPPNGCEDDLIRLTGRQILHLAAYVNTGHLHGRHEPLQAILSAWLGSAAYERLYGLTDADVAALICTERLEERP